MDAETWEKARTYGMDKEQFAITKAIVIDVLVVTLELYFGLFGYVWHRSMDIARYMNWNVYNEYSVSMVFMIIMNLFGAMKDLPFKVYGTFVLEERHGFNKQTVGFFAWDQLKGIVLGQVLTLPISTTIIYIVSNGGDLFFVALWVFLFVVTLIMILIYPLFIAPLFDTYTPLKDGPLRTAIEELAARLNFPLKKLYVVEGSKRSAHSNAYFYGVCGSKRIVLFDTLLMRQAEHSDEHERLDENADRAEEREKSVAPSVDSDKPSKRAQSVAKAQPSAAGLLDFADFDIFEKIDTSVRGCRNDEVLAVLAHELGHWKHNHFTYNIVLMQSQLLFMFVAFANLFTYRPLYQAVGFHYNEHPVLVGLILVLTYVMSPFNTAIQFGMTKVSRRFEYQADAFAKSLGYTKELARALIKLNIDNLGFPIFDPLYSAWNHSHPTLFERLVALKGDEKKQD